MIYTYICIYKKYLKNIKKYKNKKKLKNDCYVRCLWVKLSARARVICTVFLYNFVVFRIHWIQMEI